MKLISTVPMLRGKGHLYLDTDFCVFCDVDRLEQAYRGETSCLKKFNYIVNNNLYKLLDS